MKAQSVIIQRNDQLDYDMPVFGQLRKVIGNVGYGKNVWIVDMIRTFAQFCVHGKRTEWNEIGTEYCFLCDKWKIPEKNRILKVGANFPITFPNIDIELWEKADDFFNVEPTPFNHPDPEKRQHQLWIIDESNRFGLEARRSGTQENIDVMGMMQQCRHYNADAALIQQLSSMLDPRARRLAGTTWAVRPEPGEFQYGYYIGDVLYPWVINKQRARKEIYPYYTTEYIIQKDGDQRLEDNRKELRTI